MRRLRQTALPIMWLAALLCGPGATQAQLACGHFTSDVPAAPEPREAASPVRRFELINAEVKSVRHRVLFLGDSITERFDPDIWRQHMEPRGVLNAGISGDRTDHLRWRLEHGNLDDPPPQAVVLLIGTNDLGYDRSPAVTAEGIRANLLKLRQRLPRADILLLGLWPREDVPRILQRHEIAAVNQLISTCDGAARIRYADLGGLLLEPDGRLSPQISPDRLHFSAQGYARLAPTLDGLIDQLLSGR